jgi:hypothetical protein
MNHSLPSRHRWAALVLIVGLASCSGSATSPMGGSNPLPPSTPGMTAVAGAPAANTLSAINTYPGAVNGIDNRFTPTDGNTPSGGQGSPVDGVPCLPSMSNDYHIHIFLGIVVRGKMMAIPDAIGMVNPGPEVNGYVNSAQCFYEIHTHDASGIVHVEVARQIPVSTVIYHLRNVLAVWGVKHGKNFFGPFKGKMHVFIGNVPQIGTTTVTSYAPYAGHINAIPLRSHEAIWIEIGRKYFNASQLPPVTFYMEY